MNANVTRVMFVAERSTNIAKMRLAKKQDHKKQTLDLQ